MIIGIARSLALLRLRLSRFVPTFCLFVCRGAVAVSVGGAAAAESRPAIQ